MAEEAHAVRRTDVALTASAFARAVADPESSEESIVTALRSGSASPNDVSDAGTPVLCTAARLGRIDIMRALLAAGARVDERDREENTALLTAVRYGHADAAQLLINAGANKHVHDINRHTLLNVAAMNRGSVDVLHVLLSAGVPLFPMGFVRENALDTAAAFGNEPAARLLLGAGMPVDSSSRFVPGDFTPLMTAIAHSQLGMARLLLDAGADVNAVDDTGATLLMQAADYGDAAAVRMLLEAGAHTMQTDRHGDTALHWAAASERLEVMCLLLAAGVKVDTRGAWGNTPLMRAADYHCERAVRFLLLAGAQVHLADARGGTALAYVGGWHMHGQGGAVDAADLAHSTDCTLALLLAAGAGGGTQSSCASEAVGVGQVGVHDAPDTCASAAVGVLSDSGLRAWVHAHAWPTPTVAAAWLW